MKLGVRRLRHDLVEDFELGMGSDPVGDAFPEDLAIPCLGCREDLQADRTLVYHRDHASTSLVPAQRGHPFANDGARKSPGPVARCRLRSSVDGGSFDSTIAIASRGAA